MQKIIVYTAITAEKDKLRDDIKVFKNEDFNKFTNPVMNAKIFKVLPHKFISCDISIWIDGNIFLNVPPEKLVEEWLGNSDIALMEHYRKKDIYWEAKMIKATFKRRTPWVSDDVDKQIKFYEENRLIPQKEEMAMGGIIIRRHNPLVENFNEAWWAEICKWSQRDQISLPVIIKKTKNLKVNLVKGSIKNHPYLTYLNHNHFNT